ncbi:amino acid adenylation domain-containing protein [Komagataeibacter nataicola]|uniref:non-ribosomal peptide synthetase n=1 Tax=Komagataeibacter nataicola TaxID=265960 RepID=UPI0023DD08A6|nr:amino acid adenylation domain-containing protein [Komagataeibacter nataicola]WEQ54973.1 amino acid adenylation domain-containing protein [Komagataeibacter nataicola]
MILQAALAVLLGKLGAGDDIAIGSPIAGRTETALENLVGFFVNTLVLRTDLSGNPTITDLLAQVRERSLAAYGHQDLPFEKLVEILNPARAQNHHPLFQVMLVLQNTTGTHLKLTGLQAYELPVDNTVAKFDLTFTLAEDKDGLTGEIEYDTALFDAETIKSMATRYLRVLDIFASQDNRPIGSIDVLEPAERKLLLETWNDTSYDVPKATWPDLFESQVLCNPHATAVIFEEQTLTYSALNQRANQFAHYLISYGIGPEDYVGLALTPSIDLIVALLGILKSGAAYVPLDPDYPAERVDFMVSDCAPRIIITTDLINSRELFDNAQTVLILDSSSLQEKLARHSIANPSDADRIVPLRLDSPAYVIYTSGSTGTPKGVVVTHTGIASHVACQKHRFALDIASRVLLFASINFDSSVGQICSALLTGAALVVADRTRLTDPEHFTSIIQNKCVTYVDITPSFLGILSEKAIPESCLINAGGEELGIEIAKSWMQTHKIFNSYGPSETTIDAIVSEQIVSTEDVLSIGRPVFNAKIYILDGQGEPVPPGVAGELYIGGAGVARGYLNRPDLTAERFLDDPFARTPGARMYRTGDLARYRPDGNIEFLGRADQQVKIRGFRIEPGEIEARLTECSGVRTAAVIAREDIPGDRRLVGYVVPEPDATPDPATLRRALAAVLPDYMVPAALVLLDALPLTPNGKLDRKALPAPDFTPAGEGRAPRNPQEAILAALFAEVLGLTRVRIDDSFFDLGGHSLLATRLASRIRSSLNIDLPVRAVFENPTVAGLAEATAGQEDSNRPPLVPMTRPAILPLSFAQQRLWFLFRLEGPSATYNMPLSIQMDGPLSIAAMQTALGDVVARHESLRTVFPEVDGIACQQVLATEDPRCTVLLDHRHVAGHDLDRTLAAIAATPIDIANELPLRAFVLEVTPVRHVLVVLVHHIAADGWSMAPFARDLAQAYDARTAGTQPAFTPLPVQYADYTLWQRTLLGNADDPDSLYAQQADYWQTTLAGLPECITLPTDRPRPAVSAYQGATVPLIIPPPRTRRTPRCPGKGLGNQRLHDPSGRARRVAGQTRSRG